MLINSLFGLLVPYAADSGYWWLMTVRFIQGLGEVSNQLIGIHEIEKKNSFKGNRT